MEPSSQFNEPMPRAQEQISERALHSLRLTLLVSRTLLGLIALFAVTMAVAIIIHSHTWEFIVIAELILVFVMSILTLYFGLHSLHMSRAEGFKRGRILIGVAIMLGGCLAAMLTFYGLLAWFL